MIKKLISYKDHPNIIISNVTNYNFNNIFPNITYTQTIVNKDYNIIKTNKYYIIDIKLNNIVKIFDLLIETNTFKSINYIIFIGFNSINKLKQLILKNNINKYNTYKYILVTKNISNIIDNLKSSFINIRIPKLNNYKLFKSLKNTNIDNFNTIKHFNFKCIKLIDSNKLNKSNLLDDIVKYVISYNSIYNLKELAYLLITSNIDYLVLFKKILYKLSNNNKITNNKITNTIMLMCEFNNNNKNMYNNLIIYEYFLIKLNNILT